MHIAGDHIRGKSLSSELVLYVQPLYNPIGVSLGVAQLSRNVLNLPEAVNPCHQHQCLFRVLASLLWGHVHFIPDPLQKERVILVAPLNVSCRAVCPGASFQILQTHLDVLVWLLLIKPPDSPNITGGQALTACSKDGIKVDGVGG